MGLNKRVIVGIKGTKGSGKDTVASMIHYIMAVGVTAANMDGWEIYHKREKDDLDVPTIHFADKIKDDLSLMFGINRECFDKWEYKEEKYYYIKTGSFITAAKVREFSLPEITIADLQENTLLKWIESYGEDCVIKLRTLMQYYGTEVIRNQIGSNVWVNIAINKARNYKDYYGYAVIGDVRFVNESLAIYNNGGKVIHIIKTSPDKVEHSSEYISDYSKDYEMDNNGTLLGLFYKVLEFVKNEMI